MTKFLKLLRWAPLSVLALISMPAFAQVLVQSCFALTQTSKPTFTKQGSTIFATFEVKGNLDGMSTGEECKLFDAKAESAQDVTALGYTYKSENFKFTNPVQQSNCIPSISLSTRRLLYKQTGSGTCIVSFNMVYPLTGSYTGSSPSSDIIHTPSIFARKVINNSDAATGFSTTLTHSITIPPEPARTCKLTHPGNVKLTNKKPSDFSVDFQEHWAGSFSVILSCPVTAAARTGTPSLIFSYPSAYWPASSVCVATNQAPASVASPVVVVIKGLNNSKVCGDKAFGAGTVQAFADFANTHAQYTSALNFTTWIASETKNPAAGIFSTSVTLQVSYP
jgi:hypothetical protein